MSIATEITRLKNAKAALKESIEAKGVTVEDTAKLDEYPALVDSIPTGGGGGVEEKDVNFYDYDGTCVYSYTKQEFLALEEMPANPDHTNEGLISDGWNCDFDELQAFIAKYGKYDIGQTYSPSDGKTRLCVKVTDPNIEMKIYGYDLATDTLNIIVDWGDNTSPDTYENDVNIHHSYNAIGIYIITISITSGSFAFGDSYSANYSCVGNFSDRDRINAINLQYAILGNNIKAGRGSFSYCVNLKYIIFKTEHIKNNGSYYLNLFSGSGAPKCLIFDKNCTTIAEGVIDGEYNLEILCCPLHISEIYRINAYHLKSPINLVDYCKAHTVTSQVLLSGILSKDIYIDIENSIVRTISRCFLTSCTKIEVLHIPTSVTSLDSDAIAYAGQLSLKDIYLHSTVPPTITSSSFTNVGCINFYVPAGSVEAYKAANNWSALADKIFAIPTE